MFRAIIVGGDELCMARLTHHRKKTKKKTCYGEIGVYANFIYSNSRFNTNYNWKSLDECFESKRISLWTLVNLFISVWF